MRIRMEKVDDELAPSPAVEKQRPALLFFSCTPAMAESVTTERLLPDLSFAMCPELIFSVFAAELLPGGCWRMRALKNCSLQLGLLSAFQF